MNDFFRGREVKQAFEEVEVGGKLGILIQVTDKGQLSSRQENKPTREKSRVVFYGTDGWAVIVLNLLCAIVFQW